MMSHPMHLHGHQFQVTNINGVDIPGAVRDTVLIPPMSMVTIAFDADNPGCRLPPKRKNAPVRVKMST